jgi:hypothetical protein
MFQKMLLSIFVLVGVTLVTAGTAEANWAETFGGNAFDQTWVWGCYPQLTGTFTHTITDGPDNNDYLTIMETTSYDPPSYGSAFGMGFPSEVFTDVRLGAVVNVMGDASHNIHVLGGRTSYFIDPDGSITGAPGLVPTGYALLINWAGGPANLIIEVQKYVNLQNIMRIDYEVAVPGLAHNRSYYVELDIVGSNPVYLTGCLYEYKGGPLVAKLPTLIDTNANDPWEDPAVNDAPFTSGLSGLAAMNEDPGGYRTTFDAVSSLSDGPAAVNPGPADGATGVSVNADLGWKEAAFATSRDLWLGKKGDMKKVTPSPAGTTYDPGTLELGQTYEWRVDEIGAGPVTVTGHLWTFTTTPCMVIDDFESYNSDAEIAAKWVDNIAGVDYVFLDTGNVHSGSKAMRLEYQNQYAPYFTEATNTFASTQDWTAAGVKALSLFFRGRDDNVEQALYVKVEDLNGSSQKVVHPYKYAVESNIYREWTIDLKEFSNAGVNLAIVKKLTIGTGDGTNSGQTSTDSDTIYVDDIRLCPPRCFNSQQLDLRGDVNGDCQIDLEDLAGMAAGWLNDGLSVTP